MTWLEHDPENRSKDASKLLGLVKLPLLSPAVSSLTAQLFLLDRTFASDQLINQNSL